VRWQSFAPLAAGGIGVEATVAGHLLGGLGSADKGLLDAVGQAVGAAEVVGDGDAVGSAGGGEEERLGGGRAAVRKCQRILEQVGVLGAGAGTRSRGGRVGGDGDRREPHPEARRRGILSLTGGQFGQSWTTKNSMQINSYSISLMPLSSTECGCELRSNAPKNAPTRF
jgi:hypothetical protein